uniref:tRNA (guanine(26)-N(2))-dimethyltransferase n=1 Tax=Haemonchus contortus TaxID=6289 RepID=A0A6F7PSQ4_HAECO
MGETQQANLSFGDTNQEFVIVQEGKAKVGFHGPVFYNPVQEFNRDLTVSVLREFVRSRLANGSTLESKTCSEEPKPKKSKPLFEKEDGSIRILDALSASGLRALRFSQEVENVDFVLANDFSENAVESIRENIRLNGVEDKVRATFGDAVVTMMNHRNVDKRFHAVDLDPYGSASVFLDSGVQCVADRGILMVTCTDMAVLCGNTPETCYNKYGSTTVRLKCCHEMALRILLRAIDTQANKYTRYIEPLLSISVDFYVRVFVRLHTGARMTKESGTKVGHVLACSGCHSLEVVPILKKIEDGKSLKYSTGVVRQTLMGGDNKCVHCGLSVHQAGPIWTGPIHNRDFVEGMLKRLRETPEEERLGTHNRLLGVLTNVSEELDVPLYYEHDQLFNVVKCSVPKSVAVKSAILNAGFKVSGSHCNPRALKTDAPTQFLWDICRYAAQQSNVTAARHDEKAPGRKILSEPIGSEVNFRLHPKATQQTKDDQMVRFQCNKGKNWGPRSKARGSSNSTNAGFYVRPESTQQAENSSE